MRLILSFGVPVLFGYLFQQLYNVVDTAIVGKTLGGAALAAVGSTGSINFLVVGFCAGVCGGFAIPVAQQFGAGNYYELRRYVTNGVWLCALIGTVLTAGTVLLCPGILAAMDTPADIFQRSHAYIGTIFAGLPAYFLYNFCAGTLRSLGDSRTPVIWLIVSSLVNIALDMLFILTFRMDVFGAALATVLGARFRRTMRTVGEGAWIGGKAWLYPYYEGGELAFKRFPADEVLPFWADADHTILDAAVHIYVVEEYDESEQAKAVVKVEVMHGGGVDCFIRRDDGTLEPDPDGHSGDYITAEDPDTGKEQGYNWDRIPLVCFKSSHHEIPLLSRVKCLQDAYNDILSTFANQMEEDVHNTVLVIKNAEGEDLGKFRKNLAIYGAVKVRSYEGSEGGVDTLTIEVNAENYKVLLALLKDAIIENARGYDAKDERMSGNPNQMNIQSMYSDIDLDANGIEMEFQASMEELLWFVNRHLVNTGKANFDGVEVKVIFDRDVLINESEAITNCKNSVGILSDETIVKMHPWVSDPEQELERIKKEKEEAAADPYQAAFMANRQNGGNPVTGQDGGDGDGQTDYRRILGPAPQAHGGGAAGPVFWLCGEYGAAICRRSG